MQRKWLKSGEALAREIRTAAPRDHEVLAWYIGQVGFVFKGRKTVAVDPFLNDLTDGEGCSRRLYQPPFGGEKLEADYILITHGHDDHMALPTLTRVPDAKIIVPEGCVEELKNAGIPEKRIIPARAHRKLELDGLTVEPVQAAHPVHTETDLALCYRIVMNGVSLLHLGDTYLTDELYRDLLKLDTPDAFFPPINGGDYFRTARNCIGNMSAIEAARLAADLRARVSVPTHYDMMIGNTVEPYEFIRELRKNRPSAAVRLPAPGECFSVERSDRGLRRAELPDLGAVVELYKQAVGTPGCTWNDEYPTHEDAYRDLLSGGLYVYTVNGKIAGAVSVVPENELDELPCWHPGKTLCREIARIVVDNELRGNGYGADMTAEVIRRLRRQGFGSVRLLAAKCNPAAVAVYEELGFEHMGEADMYGNSYYTMEKLL